MEMLDHQRSEMSNTVYGEMAKHIVLCYETQVALRNTERRVREYNTAHVRSRREFRWRMSLATIEAQKQRLREERKRFIARRWYYNNQLRERLMSKQRMRQKRNTKCCPTNNLGMQPRPETSVQLWITRCNTCQRTEYRYLG